MPIDTISQSRLAAVARTYIDEVTPAQALKQVRLGAQWVDVRDAEELEAFDAMPDAVHLPRTRWTTDTHMALPVLNAPLVVYCAHGDRGALAALALGQQGYTQVVNVKGGLMALLLADGPAGDGDAENTA